MATPVVVITNTLLSSFPFLEQIRANRHTLTLGEGEQLNSSLFLGHKPHTFWGKAYRNWVLGEESTIPTVLGCLYFFNLWPLLGHMTIQDHSTITLLSKGGHNKKNSCFICSWKIFYLLILIIWDGIYDSREISTFMHLSMTWYLIVRSFLDPEFIPVS